MVVGLAVGTVEPLHEMRLLRDHAAPVIDQRLGLVAQHLACAPQRGLVLMAPPDSFLDGAQLLAGDGRAPDSRAAVIISSDVVHATLR